MTIDASRQQLKKYGRVIAMWLSKFDTCEIAAELKLDEAVVSKWVANFRDMTLPEAA